MFCFLTFLVFPEVESEPGGCGSGSEGISSPFSDFCLTVHTCDVLFSWRKTEFLSDCFTEKTLLCLYILICRKGSRFIFITFSDGFPCTCVSH